MPSRRGLLHSGAALCATLAGCLSAPGAQPTTVEFTEGFEDGLAAWQRRSDVPEDPNRPGQPVAWEITHTSSRAASGDASARYFLDGSQDDGTIWLHRPVELEPDRRYEVTMEAQAWSESESFNTLAYLVMYAGPRPPTAEGSFPAPGENTTAAGRTPTGGLRETLNQSEGWRPYSFTWSTPVLETGSIHVAVGISAVWETRMEYFVDDVYLRAEPR